jgi:hypothetical protein
VWAFYHQYKATVLLANLRKDRKGSIVTLQHQVPHGDLFELVSSPHNLAEILMYLALTFILLGSNTWPFVFLWVLSNQVSHAVDTVGAYLILICYKLHLSVYRSHSNDITNCLLLPTQCDNIGYFTEYSKVYSYDRFY